MNRRHLVLVIAACLALSSSTLAMAEGKSKQVRSKHLAHGKVLAPTTPITLGSSSGIIKLDTSTAVPLIKFDTSTVTTHTDLDSASGIIKLDTSTAVPLIKFDTSTATSHIDLESDDDGKQAAVPPTIQRKSEHASGTHD